MAVGTIIIFSVNFLVNIEYLLPFRQIELYIYEFLVLATGCPKVTNFIFVVY